MTDVLLMVVRSVSAPFDAGQIVEVKLDVEGPYEVRGELFLRVPADEAKQWLPGDVHGARLKRL